MEKIVREPADGKRPEAVRRNPYRTPTLRVYGTVASMTESATSAHTNMDGGSNNTKT